MAVAPASPILLSKRSSFLTEVLVCRKSNEKTRSAADNWGENASRYHVMGHSYFVLYLENHAQYTCLRIAEAFASEVELGDRWVVGLELGHWNATELLQRLALLLSNIILPMKAQIYHHESQIALTTATWASLAAASPVISELPATLMLLMVELT